MCKRRKDYSHNDEVWDIRFKWAEFKPQLQKALLAGEYTISSQIVINTPERRSELWSAKDALVLNAISIVLGEHLKPVLSRNCYHLAGNGGAKAAVRATARYLKKGQHVMKSDVKGYYASIDNHIVGICSLTIYHNVAINYIVNTFLRRCRDELLCRN